MELKDKKEKYIVEKKKGLFTSFGHAFDGIKSAFATEYHMIVHGYFAICVIIAGALFQISYVEWLICLMLIGMVIALELVNTAIEAVTNMITTENNYFAKTAKDVSAGAVLVMSIISAFIGLVIFIPKFIELF